VQHGCGFKSHVRVSRAQGAYLGYPISADGALSRGVQMQGSYRWCVVSGTMRACAIDVREGFGIRHAKRGFVSQRGKSDRVRCRDEGTILALEISFGVCCLRERNVGEIECSGSEQGDGEIHATTHNSILLTAIDGEVFKPSQRSSLAQTLKI
jgi:hypothetical protein